LNYIITGKAGAGKSTLAKEIRSERLYYCLNCIILDGDDVRQEFDGGFTDDDILEHIIRMGKFTNILNRQGYGVVIAAILPKVEWRVKLREIIERETEMIYIPGGIMWEGTIYEEPVEKENFEIYDWRKM